MTQKPHTYVADLVKLPKALEHLTKQKRWVIWRWKKVVKKNGEVVDQSGRPAKCFLNEDLFHGE